PLWFRGLGVDRVAVGTPVVSGSADVLSGTTGPAGPERGGHRFTQFETRASPEQEYEMGNVTGPGLIHKRARIGSRHGGRLVIALLYRPQDPAKNRRVDQATNIKSYIRVLGI